MLKATAGKRCTVQRWSEIFPDLPAHPEEKVMETSASLKAKEASLESRQRRNEQHKSLPTMDEIRRQLGWNLMAAAHKNASA